MVHTGKPYDPQNAAIYDKPGKDVARSLMISQGITEIEENPEENMINGYWDLRGKYKNQDVRVDTEIKNNWDRDRFPFPDIQIPYRKIDKKTINPTSHIIVSKDFKRAFLVKRDVVESSPTRIVRAKNRNYEEELYVTVDRLRGRFFYFDGATWSLDPLNMPKES